MPGPSEQEITNDSSKSVEVKPDVTPTPTGNLATSPAPSPGPQQGETLDEQPEEVVGKNAKVKAGNEQGLRFENNERPESKKGDQAGAEEEKQDSDKDNMSKIFDSFARMADGSPQRGDALAPQSPSFGNGKGVAASEAKVGDAPKPMASAGGAANSNTESKDPLSQLVDELVTTLRDLDKKIVQTIEQVKPSQPQMTKGAEAGNQPTTQNTVRNTPSVEETVALSETEKHLKTMAREDEHPREASSDQLVDDAGDDPSLDEEEDFEFADEDPLDTKADTSELFSEEDSVSLSAGPDTEGPTTISEFMGSEETEQAFGSYQALADSVNNPAPKDSPTQEQTFDGPSLNF